MTTIASLLLKGDRGSEAEYAAMIAPADPSRFSARSLPHFSHPFLRQLDERVALVLNAV